MGLTRAIVCDGHLLRIAGKFRYDDSRPRDIDSRAQFFVAFILVFRVDNLTHNLTAETLILLKIRLFL